LKLSESELVNNNQDWVSCIQNSQKKLCRLSPLATDLYCCDPFDTSYQCGYATKSLCDDETEVDSAYILCPYNSDGCRNEQYYIDAYYSLNVYADYIPRGGSCVYKLEKSSYNHRGISIKPEIIKNVDVSVYTKKGDAYEFQYSIDSNYNYEYKTKVSNYDDIYIVVIPTNGNNGGFSVYADVYGNTDLSGGAIAGISIASVALFCIFVACCCCWCKRRRKAKLLKNQARKLETEQLIAPQHQEHVNGQVQPPANPGQSQQNYTNFPQYPQNSSQNRQPQQYNQGYPINQSNSQGYMADPIYSNQTMPSPQPAQPSNSNYMPNNLAYPVTKGQ